MTFKSLFDDGELFLEHRVCAAMFTYPVSLDETPSRSFTHVHQRGEIDLRSQLQLSGQQIYSTVISRPESILTR